MSRKTRKLIWSAPLVAVFAVVGALAMFAAQGTGSVFANPLPAAPMNLEVEAAAGDAGRTTLVVTWDAADNAAGYRIDGSDNGFVWETLVAADAGHTATTYMEDGLTSEDTRWYRVFAVNSHGVGPVSSPNSGETDERVMPGPVRNFMATADGRNQLNLTWDPPMDNGGEKITGYEIQYYNTAEADPNWYGLPVGTTAGTAEGSGAATDYLLVTQDDYMMNGGYEDKDSETLSLDPGDSRMYRIRAVNVAIPTDRTTLTAADRSKDWAGATGMTQAAGNPGAPTGLTAVNQEAAGTVRLYWFDPENNGGWEISHYVIQVRRNVSGADWKKLPDVPDAGDYAADAFDTGNIGTDESYNFRITDPDAQVHQAEFTAVPTTWDHDDDTSTDEVPVSWQFRVLAETTDDGADDDATKTADNKLRRSTGTSEVATIRAVVRPAVADDTLGAPDVTATARVSATDAGTSEVQQINLTINIASGATNVTEQNAYRIDVSEDAGATWKPLVQDTRFTGFGDNREYEHVNLPYDETMHYRVFTVGTNWRRNVGPASALVPGSTRASMAPGKATGVMASAPDLETIMASWMAPEKDGGQPVSNYRYRYVLDDGDGVADAGDFAGTDTARPITTGNTGNANLMATIEVADQDTTAADDQPLTEDKTYWFQVAAINKDPLGSPANVERPAANSETWSDAAMLSTGDANPPNMVEGLMSQVAMDTSGNVTGVLLLWNKPSEGPEVASYEVQRKIGDGEWEHPTDDAEESTSMRTSFTDPRHHMMGEMLAYQVRAVNAAGESGWAMVYYPRDPAMMHYPGSPTNVTATKDAAMPTSQINLMWSAPANGVSVTGYIIERAYGSVMFLDADDGVAHANFAFSDHMEWWETLNCNGMLAAVGSSETMVDNPAADSDQAKYCAHYDMTAPSNTAGTIMAGSDVDTKIEEYFNKRYEIVGNVTSHMDTGLMDGTEYSYRVRAAHGDAAGPWSDTASAMTDSADTTLMAPTNVMATSDAAGKITITWEGAENADSFVLVALDLAGYAAGNSRYYETSSVDDGSATMGDITALTSETEYAVLVIAIQGTGANEVYEFGFGTDNVTVR